MRLNAKLLKRADTQDSDDAAYKDAQELCESIGGSVEDAYDHESQISRYRISVNGSYVGYFKEVSFLPTFYFYVVQNLDPSVVEDVKDWLVANSYDEESDCWCKYV
jgi:hypothetical protein